MINDAMYNDDKNKNENISMKIDEKGFYFEGNKEIIIKNRKNKEIKLIRKRKNKPVTFRESTFTESSFINNYNEIQINENDIIDCINKFCIEDTSDIFNVKKSNIVNMDINTYIKLSDMIKTSSLEDIKKKIEAAIIIFNVYFNNIFTDEIIKEIIINEREDILLWIIDNKCLIDKNILKFILNINLKIKNKKRMIEILIDNGAKINFGPEENIDISLIHHIFDYKKNDINFIAKLLIFDDKLIDKYNKIIFNKLIDNNFFKDFY